MKRSIRITLAVVAVLLMSAMSGQAERGGGGRGGGWGGGRGGGWGGGHGGGWGWGPAMGLGLGLGLWGLSNSYYGYPYYPYYDAAPINEQPSTEMYVRPAPQQPAEPTYWYYCRAPEGYYPYVKQCPGGWMKVVPTPPQPQ
jgi:hypothetical protein